MHEAPPSRIARAAGGAGAEPGVRAAGGVVVREAADGGVEFALVHRPRYGDWSLPKGKLAPGEQWEAAALREVAEETGLRCEIGRELEPARYRDRHGREKLVRFWVMRPISGEFVPTGEVDELRWLPSEDAVARLDYEHDRALIRAVAGSDKRPAG